MPDAPLPPLPPVGQSRWRTAADELRRRFPAADGAPLRPLRLLLAAALVAVAAGGAGLVLRRPASPGVGPALPMAVPAPPEPTGPADPAVRPQPDGEVVVDVAGAVARPGLVRLRTGSRVADAVAAAGGLADDAAPVGLNQAMVLADGEQVRVPRVGEPAPPSPPASSAASPAGAPAAPVDLNRATAAELEALPGVGPATATAIITWRGENGGFRRVDDLLEVPGIGPARLERLRPHVRI